MDNHRRRSIAIRPKILISKVDIQSENPLTVDYESDPLPLNPGKYLMKMKDMRESNVRETDYAEGSLGDHKNTMIHVPNCIEGCREITNGRSNCDGAETDDKTLSERFIEENGSVCNLHQDENSRKGSCERIPLGNHKEGHVINRVTTDVPTHTISHLSGERQDTCLSYMYLPPKKLRKLIDPLITNTNKLTKISLSACNISACGIKQHLGMSVTKAKLNEVHDISGTTYISKKQDERHESQEKNNASSANEHTYSGTNCLCTKCCGAVGISDSTSDMSESTFMSKTEDERPGSHENSGATSVNKHSNTSSRTNGLCTCHAVETIFGTFSDANGPTDSNTKLTQPIMPNVNHTDIQEVDAKDNVLDVEAETTEDRYSKCRNLNGILDTDTREMTFIMSKQQQESNSGLIVMGSLPQSINSECGSHDNERLESIVIESNSNNDKTNEDCSDITDSNTEVNDDVLNSFDITNSYDISDSNNDTFNVSDSKKNNSDDINRLDFNDSSRENDNDGLNIDDIHDIDNITGNINDSAESDINDCNDSCHVNNDSNDVNDSGDICDSCDVNYINDSDSVDIDIACDKHCINDSDIVINVNGSPDINDSNSDINESDIVINVNDKPDVDDSSDVKDRNHKINGFGLQGPSISSAKMKISTIGTKFESTPCKTGYVLFTQDQKYDSMKDNECSAADSVQFHVLPPSGELISPAVISSALDVHKLIDSDTNVMKLDPVQITYKEGFV